MYTYAVSCWLPNHIRWTWTRNPKPLPIYTANQLKSAISISLWIVQVLCNILPKWVIQTEIVLGTLPQWHICYCQVYTLIITIVITILVDYSGKETKTLTESSISKSSIMDYFTQFDIMMMTLQQMTQMALMHRLENHFHSLIWIMMGKNYSY